MEGMLTLKEVMEFLELDQPEVEKLVKKRKLDAYKIGGAFLRFKKPQVVFLKQQMKRESGAHATELLPRLRDFWVFNRFYILTFVLFVLLIYWALNR